MTAPYPAAALEPEVTAPLVLALPKGRILAECGQLLARAGVAPAPDYADEESRRLRFPTDDPTLDVVRVRPFDVATFVAFGAAQLGICGADVLMEFDYPEIYAPLDLGIGVCRVSVAEPAATAGTDDPSRWSRVRVATKYPNIARRHFASRGVHAEVVHLNGAMELAPGLGLSRLIVDLVQTGSTLRANGLVETEVIAPITSRLIVNRTALKTQPEAIGAWIARFRAALGELRWWAFDGRVPPPSPQPPPARGGGMNGRLLAMIRLATIDAGFEAAFTALLGQARETTETSIRRSRPSSPTCAPRATRRCCATRQRFDRLALDRGAGCAFGADEIEAAAARHRRLR